MGLNDILPVLLQHCIPIGANLLNSHLSKRNSERLREIGLDELNKRERVILKHHGNDPESHKIHINDEIPEVPEFEFKEGEDIDKVGKRMWKTYHDLSLRLPDHATRSQVRVFLRKIERSMRNHPCEECRVNVAKHLKGTRMIGSTKKDAVKKIFEIHNKVSKSLDKPQYSTEQFKRTYNYSLD